MVATSHVWLYKLKYKIENCYPVSLVFCAIPSIWELQTVLQRVTCLYLFCIIGISSGYITARGFQALKAGLCWYYHISLQMGCSNLHFHQQCMSMAVSPQLCRHNLLSYLKDFATVMGEKLHFSVVLICTSLNMSEFEHFLICLRGIVIFVNCPFLPFPHFSLWFLFLCALTFRNSYILV